MGATVNVGVRVGADAVVGNSAVVKADVPAGTRIKAGQIWG
jgi:acetyltransferase-like isoleucine patch superfamily enzyme